MKFADFKKEGGFEDAEGCWHDDADSLLQTGIFKFCGCGRPEDNLDYILGGLELIAEKPPQGYDAFSAWFDKHQERVRAHFGSMKAAYFFYYWADKEDLTEHGGSVPGWLTDKGHDLMLMLRGAKDERPPEEDDTANSTSTTRQGE